MELSQADIERFQADGVVCLRGVFSEEWINTLTKGIEKNLQNPSEYSEKLKTNAGPGYYFNDYCNWQTIHEFKEFIFHSPAGALAGKLMKSQSAIFYHEHVLTKDAGTFKETPWHQDQPYYPVDGFQNCSIWLPVDPVPVETSIKFVKGSHLWNKWFYPRKFASSLNYPINDEMCDTRPYTDVPDINNSQYQILEWPTKPGDCIVFHMLTLHGAPSNTTDQPRRVLSTRWLGDDSTLARRPWQVSPPVDGGLKFGDKMTCETFPVVWSSRSDT